MQFQSVKGNFFFLTWRNSMRHLCFIRTSTSCAILSDCPAAICYTTNLMEHWQEGSASTAMPSTSTSDMVGQHNETGGIIFRSTLIHGTFCLSSIMNFCYSGSKHSPFFPVVREKKKITL